MKKIIVTITLVISLVLPSISKAQSQQFLAYSGWTQGSGDIILGLKIDSPNVLPVHVDVLISEVSTFGSDSAIGFSTTDHFIQTNYDPSLDTIHALPLHAYFKASVHIYSDSATTTQIIYCYTEHPSGIVVINKNVVYENVPKNSTIWITALDGQTLGEFEILDTKGQVDIHNLHLQPGIYIVSLQNGGTMISADKIYIE